MKHMLRQPVGTGFACRRRLRGTLRLSHRGSDTQFELPLAIDANGIGETSWTAPAGAPMGDYDLPVDGAARAARSRSSQSFRVDEYKLPTMRATVDRAEGGGGAARASCRSTCSSAISRAAAPANLPVDVRVGWFAHERGARGL